MTLNYVENGSTVPSQGSQSNLIYLNQLVEPCQITSNCLNGDAEYSEQQNYPLNFGNQAQNQIPQNISFMNRITDIGEINRESIGFINESALVRPNNNTGIVFDPFLVNNNQIPLNQQVARYNGIANGFPEEISNINYAQNYIVTFSSPPAETINQMGNMVTLNNNNGNAYDCFGQLIAGVPWFNNTVPNITHMDARQIYANRSLDRHDRLKHVHNLHNGDSRFSKPVFSYSCLIALALKNSESGSLPVNEIYKYMQENFPYFKSAPDGWKNSVRHNLSLNKAFQKTVRSDATSTQRKGCLWTLKPEKRRSIEKEIRKWFKKHPEAIRRSMSNPENFDGYFNEKFDDSGEDGSRPHTREDSNPDQASNSGNDINKNPELTNSSFDSNNLYCGPIFCQPPNQGLLNPSEMDLSFNDSFNEFVDGSNNIIHSLQLKEETFGRTGNVNRTKKGTPKHTGCSNSDTEFDVDQFGLL